MAIFLKPIALHHERELFADRDGTWLSVYPAPPRKLLPGEIGVHNSDAKDMLIVSYANVLRLSLSAARRLKEQAIAAPVLDVRWLNPFPLDAIRAHAAECGCVLVAEECRAAGGGIADAVIAALPRAATAARSLRSARSTPTSRSQRRRISC